MIKTLTTANRSEKVDFKIPRSVQQSIPIQRIYSDGIFHVGRKLSKTWRFADVNYVAASEDVKLSIFQSYSGVLNSLPTDAAAKITIINRKLNQESFEKTVLMKERGDDLDKYRRESNRIMREKAAESNDLVQEKYITLSVPQRKIEDTRSYFRRVEGNLTKSFGRLDSGARPISCHDRLRIFHDFFRPGEEQQMGPNRLHGGHKSIIDRCTAAMYHSSLRNRSGPAPLLTDWRNVALQQPDPEARELALVAELITEGSLNIFAQPTNVDLRNRIITFDAYEMGESLRDSSHAVMLEITNNRVAENRANGKFTWVFIDEVYLYFKYQYSAENLYRAWKRYRKYGATMTAATQNVEECLRSETARLMFANSEFLLLFNQAATDRQELAKLLHLSQTQMDYITNSPPGHGLLRMGGALVPFANLIPHDSILYKLMSTTPGER